MHKVILLISITLLSERIFAFDSSNCGTSLTKDSLNNTVTTLIHKHFPKIQKHNERKLLKLKYFRGSEYYLKATFKLTHSFKKRYKRKLFLHISEDFLRCPPREEAIESIIIHELFHLSDYLNASTKDLVKLGSKYLSRKSRAKYERHTDLRAMRLNYAYGLIKYREWVYQKLTKKQLRKKKTLYYTPIEIRKWIKSN